MLSFAREGLRQAVRFSCPFATVLGSKPPSTDCFARFFADRRYSATPPPFACTLEAKWSDFEAPIA